MAPPLNVVMRATGEYTTMCVVGESPDIATQAQLTREELRLLTFYVQPVSKHKRSPIQVLNETNIA